MRLASARIVKRRSGPPSHGPPGPRRGTASPPPTHPVYTAAPSVEGSAGRLGGYSGAVKDYFRKSCVDKARHGALGRNALTGALGIGEGRKPRGYWASSGPL